MKKVYLLSLGCPRNLLDSEVLLGRLLEENSFEIVEEAQGADIAIVNTCGFIQDAKEESINVILKLASLKKEGSLEKIVVTGCLSQRYPKELLEEIKEIDAVFGTSDFVKIPEALMALAQDKRLKEVSKEPSFLYDHSFKRRLLTPCHYAYVKIQEGCSNRCSYCVIPDLKGPRRSRAITSILDEVRFLKGEYDIKEVILIGQDTTSFGIDTSGKYLLPELLLNLSPIMQDGWIRLLYTHPMHFTRELMDAINSAGNICRYIDLPIQHINDKILREMERHITKKEIIALITEIRKSIKDVAIRSSVIVGFPGEEERHFKELLDFIKDVRFERLGAFLYSPEKGTKAASFKGQISKKEKRRRFDEVMRVQQDVSLKNNARFLGRKMKVLVDEAGSCHSRGGTTRSVVRNPQNTLNFIGRTEMDAPEVDGSVYVKTSRDLKIGDFCDVKIIGTNEYDLIGEALDN